MNQQWYQSLEELYMENYKLVYLFIEDYVQDVQVVRELSATVWLKIVEHQEQCLKMEKPWVKNYLRVVCRNTAFDYMKRDKRDRQAVEDLKNLESTGMSEQISHGIREEDVWRYLDEIKKKLTSEEKQILYLKYNQKLSWKDIAELLDILEGTLRSKHFRLVRKLRREISKRMEEGGIHHE